MGLLTIIRKNRQKEKEMRILFLGLDNAGKTTILKKLSGEDIMSVSPTFGFNIKTFVHGNFTLNIWDVGGQRTLRPYWRNYFEQTDALVWVVDSGDRMRMQDCKEELHSLLLEDRLAGASLLVFANKQDLPGSLTDIEIRDVSRVAFIHISRFKPSLIEALPGARTPFNQVPPLEDMVLQRCNRRKPRHGLGLGRRGRRWTAVLFRCSIT